MSVCPLPVYPSFSLFISSAFGHSVSLSFLLLICLSVCMSVFFMLLSEHLSIFYMSVCFSVCLSVGLNLKWFCTILSILYFFTIDGGITSVPEKQTQQQNQDNLVTPMDVIFFDYALDNINLKAHNDFLWVSKLHLHSTHVIK